MSNAAVRTVHIVLVSLLCFAALLILLGVGVIS